MEKSPADVIAQTLTRHGLRQTPVRLGVLRALKEAHYALSGHEIEQLLGPGTDRITLYRTLRSFEDKGLIHRVIDASDIVRYAACSLGCTEQQHADNHVHFKCTRCAHIYCLNQVAIPAVTLPASFQAQHGDYLLSGVCAECH
ncbi:Fur family transcriptional regulator [Hymenobacter cavernae]|uniref:Transcriptional regulator n=1 Tax=Hymenobacter cavernae TaxID=2044852 RepID=A0ABQ1TUX8_9BACT|nr:transcriptional repressor [Hymenobacter cavernae]GGF03983.1 transcriptional regulator [Hymenobacter cavernae]